MNKLSVLKKYNRSLKGHTDKMNMNYYNKQFLQEHYNKILEQNLQKLLSGGTGDPFLTSSAADTRMSLVLVIRIDPEIADKIDNHLNSIKKIEPSLYYYPRQSFHITVMDILKGESYRKIPQNINQYIQCIKECTQQIHPFYIAFDGMTASDNAAMVKGYYEYELERFRKLLRQSLNEQSLLLEERYETFSSHITTVRIPVKLAKPRAFVEYIKQPVYFGMMKVNSLELVFHDWYDAQKIVLSQFLLY